MHIVHVIWCRFPVEGYGGTERVAYWLGKAQAELGHKVTYLCLPGSRLGFAETRELPGELRELDPLLPKDTDIVQLYGTPNFSVSAPYLVNIGGNGSAGERFPANTVFVSEDHARRHHWSEFVHNGIDLSEYPLGKGKRDGGAAFLAKASWRVKNLRGAIAIAREGGLRLKVCGGKAGWWYRGVESFGIIGGTKKLELLQAAQLLLFPVIWEEPFGLAVVEAMACGTPVVATPRGALLEIIDAKSGLLKNSHAELVEAVQGIASGRLRFEPEACRARVAEAFTHIHMAEKYLSYYKRVLANGKLREGTPYAAPDADPQKKTYYAGYRSAWI